MKAIIRQNMLDKMRTLSPEQRRLIEDELYRQLSKHVLWQQAKCVGITLSRYPEWETRALIALAWQENKQVVVPKISNKEMLFVPYTSDTVLAKAGLGIFEPIDTGAVEASQIDLMIVPGVAFNESGYRIGFGAGYYDRYLAHYQGHTVALCWQEQLVDFVVADHDIAVQTCIIATGEMLV